MAKSVFYSRKNYMCDPNLAGKLKRDLEVAFFLLPPSSVLLNLMRMRMQMK